MAALATRVLRKAWRVGRSAVASTTRHRGAAPPAAATLETSTFGWHALPACAPLQTFRVAAPSGGRVTLIADRFDNGSMDDAALEAAAVLAALLCSARRPVLRIVTRCEPAEPTALNRVLGAAKTTLLGDPQFVFAPIGSTDGWIDIVDDELFVSVGWEATVATRGAVPARSLRCLMGDDARRGLSGEALAVCHALLRDRSVRRVLGSAALRDRLAADGLAGDGYDDLVVDAAPGAHAAPRRWSETFAALLPHDAR